MERKETYDKIQHSGDSVQFDVANNRNHDVLKQKRGVGMDQDTWALDGEPNELPHTEHDQPFSQKKGGKL